jgi:hypothetical protein
MTVSPSNTQATAVELRNGNGNSPQNMTINVSFSNAPAGATFTWSGGDHLNVSKLGNALNISVKNGNGNRGLYSVTITPPNGCGASKTVYINVAQ